MSSRHLTRLHRGRRRDPGPRCRPVVMTECRVGAGPLGGVVGLRDTELVAAVNGGRREAYEELVRRHVEAARRFARQLTRCPADTDDLVAEAFARMFTACLDNDPDRIRSFRAYLLTVLRNLRIDRARHDKRVEPCGDMSAHDIAVTDVDPVLVDYEATLIGQAFNRLDPRHQRVLWHMAVNRADLADLADMFGLTPNAVSALAYRAREQLRQRYLQLHLQQPRPSGCRPTVERLGGWVRRTLPARTRRQVEQHLADCPRCRIDANYLTDIDQAIFAPAARRW